MAIGLTATPNFNNSGLQPDTDYYYHYQVSEKDSQGNNSDLRTTLTVRTLSAGGIPPVWVAGFQYKEGGLVNHKGATYVCMMVHTSTFWWAPDNATSLWQHA